MDNLKTSAYPQPFSMEKGFSKLELASLMITQGFAACPKTMAGGDEEFAKNAVSLAKAVLEEANK